MTIKELKELLENLPDDAECFVYEDHNTFTGQIYWQKCGFSYDEEFNLVIFS